MKFITHNLLTSRFLRDVQTGYPLKLAVDKFEEIETDYNKDFLQTMHSKVDYQALKKAAQICGQQLPDSLPDFNAPNKDDLKVALSSAPSREGSSQ